MMSNTTPEQPTPGQPDTKPAEMVSRDKMATTEVLAALIERVDWLICNHLDVDNILPLIDEAIGFEAAHDEAVAAAAQAVVNDALATNTATDDGNGEPVELTVAVAADKLDSEPPASDAQLAELKQKEDQAQAAEGAKRREMVEQGNADYQQRKNNPVD